MTTQRNVLLALLLALVSAVAWWLSMGSSISTELEATGTTAQSSVVYDVTLPQEIKGMWRPAVDRRYVEELREVYTDSRVPGAPTFDKKAFDIQGMKRVTWAISDSDILARFGPKEERQPVRVVARGSDWATVQVPSRSGKVVEVRLQLLDTDTLEMTFPAAARVPGIRMLRVAP